MPSWLEGANLGEGLFREENPTRVNLCTTTHYNIIALRKSTKANVLGGHLLLFMHRLDMCFEIKVVLV